MTEQATETQIAESHPLDDFRCTGKRHLATIRWSFGEPVPAFHGSTDGVRFVGEASMVLKACAALVSRGAQEKTPAPYDGSQFKVELWSWYDQQAYSDHGGWALVNRGLSFEQFTWVVTKLEAVWPPNKGNYSARGFVRFAESSAIFESGCHGIGD